MDKLATGYQVLKHLGKCMNLSSTDITSMRMSFNKTTKQEEVSTICPMK
jgi:hypothetical protein